MDGREEDTWSRPSSKDTSVKGHRELRGLEAAAIPPWTLGRGAGQRMDEPECWERSKPFTLSAASVLDSAEKSL